MSAFLQVLVDHYPPLKDAEQLKDRVLTWLKDYAATGEKRTNEELRTCARQLRLPTPPLIASWDLGSKRDERAKRLHAVPLPASSARPAYAGTMGTECVGPVGEPASAP